MRPAKYLNLIFTPLVHLSPVPTFPRLHSTHNGKGEKKKKTSEIFIISSISIEGKFMLYFFRLSAPFSTAINSNSNNNKQDERMEGKKESPFPSSSCSSFTCCLLVPLIPNLVYLFIFFPSSLRFPSNNLFLNKHQTLCFAPTEIFMFIPVYYLI